MSHRLSGWREQKENRAEGRLTLLGEVCGPLAEDVEGRIRSLSAEQLVKLAKSLLHFQSITDLENWLNAHAAMPE